MSSEPITFPNANYGVSINPDTVQPYMTSAAAATARSAVLAVHTSGKATR